MHRQAPSETNGFTGWVSDLARSHTRRLVTVARHEGLEPEDALDAVQEAYGTFLVLPQARTLVLGEEDAGVLLAVLVRNAARNMRRRHHRSVPHERISDAPGIMGEDVLADELISRAEEHVRLAGCVHHLSQIQQAVVRLRALQELSGRETAELLGMPAARVAVHLYRAKKALLVCLAS